MTAQLIILLIIILKTTQSKDTCLVALATNDVNKSFLYMEYTTALKNYYYILLIGIVIINKNIEWKKHKLVAYIYNGKYVTL